MKQKYIKKLLHGVLAAAMLAVSGANASALPETIHSNIETGMVASGVRHEKITRFTDDGWLDVNIIRADLTNSHVKVDTIVDSTSMRTLSSPLDLMESENAVAAINGSFFMWGEEANKVIPIGPIVSSGELLTAYSSLNSTMQTMATLCVNSAGKASCDYWETSIWIEAPNRAVLIAGRYNRPFYGYTDLTILDRTWGNMTPGAGKYTRMVEMIVENGRVTEIREGKSSTVIPGNGYVVVTCGSGADMLLDNFKKGDSVSLHISTTPDWKKMIMAVSGGAVLLRNGKIPGVFTHEITGRHPRSALGCSENGNQLIMVTVDGRQDSSFGLTQREMAELMLELGAFNAINLDGGGSSAILARPLGKEEPEVLNSPSDGILRRVPNIVGVVSSAPQSYLYGMVINTSDTRIFAGTSREFDVLGYDMYFNPVSINLSAVNWSTDGIEGRFEDNIFYPSQPGHGKVIAEINGVASETEIEVLKPPVQLVPDLKSIKLAVGESRQISFYGGDISGQNALIDPRDLNYSFNGIKADFKEGKLTPLAKGGGYMDAWVGNTHAYIEVLVPGYTVELLDDFEELNAAFLGYPDTVEGSYSISSNHPFAGNFSGKLKYNFIENPDITRAAYVEFFNEGIPLHPSTVKLGLEVYNTHPTTNWLRAEIYDTDGKMHRVDFVREMEWTKWNHVEARIEGFTPARLSRIYAAQIRRVQDIGNIYFDNLTATVFKYSGNADVPEDTRPADSDVQSVVYTPSPDSFRFSVFSQKKKPANPLERVLTRRMAEKINSYIDLSMLTGSGCEEISGQVEKPQLSSLGGGFSSLDKMNTRFIMLDAGSGSLRTAASGQWQWLMGRLRNFKGKQVFIFMDQSPYSFTDTEEGNLFRQVLSDFSKDKSYKIWVFCPGATDRSYMDNGVKYIEATGFSHQDVTPQNLDAATYVLVTVRGDKVTYEIKPIL